MRLKLTRRHWILVAVASPMLLVYFGFYLHFRLNRTFIHRAGRYDARVSHGRPLVATNHFIEPGQVADGPAVFASVVLVAATAPETNRAARADFDKMLTEGMEQVDQAQRRRDGLFLVFKPAALLETMVWTIIDPDPLGRTD